MPRIFSSNGEVAWVDWFTSVGGLYLYNDEVDKPHPVWWGAQEYHMDGTLCTGPILEKASLVDQACQSLASMTNTHLGDAGLQIEADTRVFGLGRPEDVTALVHNLAVHLKCKSGYTEIMCLQGRLPAKGERVLLVIDKLLTIPGWEDDGLNGTIQILRRSGIEFLPHIVCLVNATGLSEIHGFKIISLVNQKITMWPADKCPLCQSGSPSIASGDLLTITKRIRPD